MNQEQKELTTWFHELSEEELIEAYSENLVRFSSPSTPVKGNFMTPLDTARANPVDLPDLTSYIESLEASQQAKALQEISAQVDAQDDEIEEAIMVAEAASRAYEMTMKVQELRKYADLLEDQADELHKFAMCPSNFM